MRLLIAVCCVLFVAGARGQAAPAAHSAPVQTGPASARLMRETGPPPPLPHPTTEAQLRDFLALTDAAGHVHKDMDQAVDSMRARAPAYFPASVLNEIGANLRALDVVQVYLPYYQAYVSEQDMNALLVFYRSDAGKHYAAVQETLIGGAQSRLSAEVQSTVQTTLLKHKDEIEAAKKNYEEKAAPASK